MLPSFNTHHSKSFQSVQSYFVIGFQENNKITFYIVQKTVCLNEIVKTHFEF